MAKVFHVCYGFASLRIVVWLKNSRTFLIQSEIQTELIVTHSHVFPCFSRRLH